MKHCQYFFIALLLLFFTTGCKKAFLDAPVTNKVAAETYLNNLSGAQEFLNGIYFMLARDVYDYNHILYSDIIADNLKSPSGLVLNNHYSWNMIASESPQNGDNLNTLWLKGYGVIRSCNYFLEQIDRLSAENPAQADYMKGQVYAIRALVHHTILNVFAQPYKFTADASHAGIPYLTVYDQPAQSTRQTVKEVYDAIIGDLNHAVELIPATQKSKSAFSQMAAKALLARVYLFRGDFSNAKKLAVEVAAAVPLMKSSDYPSKLYTANDNESIFWLAPAQTSNALSTLFQGYIFAQNAAVATTDIVNAIKERSGDLRNSWFQLISGNWSVKKFPPTAIAGITLNGAGYYQTVIRSSEIFLTAAEAYAQTGDEPNARNCLDSIRRRADVLAPLSTATGSALLDSIYKERRKELCFENLRMYDLLRLGKGVNRTDVVSPAPASLPYPSDKAIAPIPLTDVKAYQLEQNHGY